MQVVENRIANETDFVVDFLGQRIKVGDIISYPVRHSSCMEMHVARVNQVVIEKRLYGRAPTAIHQEHPVLWVSVHTARSYYKDVSTGIRYDKWVGNSIAVHLTSFQEPCLRKSVISRVDNVTVVTKNISEGLSDFFKNN